ENVGVCCMTVVQIRLSKKWGNSAQGSAKGARPESGNENTEFSLAEWKPVSMPCTNGDDADSAMKCGTYRDRPCSSTSAESGPGQPTCTCWPKIVNCLDR